MSNNIPLIDITGDDDANKILKMPKSKISAKILINFSTIILFDDWMQIDKKKFISADGENYFCSSCLKFGNFFHIKLKQDDEHSEVCQKTVVKNISSEMEFDKFIKNNLAVKGYSFNGRKYLKIPNENYFHCNLCLINRKFVKTEFEIDGQHPKECQELVSKTESTFEEQSIVVKVAKEPPEKITETPKISVTPKLVKSELDDNLNVIENTSISPRKFFIDASRLHSDIPPSKAIPVQPMASNYPALATHLRIHQPISQSLPRNVTIRIRPNENEHVYTPKRPTILGKRKLLTTEPIRKQIVNPVTNLAPSLIIETPINEEGSSVSPDSDSVDIFGKRSSFNKKIKRNKFAENLFVPTDLEYKLVVKKDTTSAILILIKEKCTENGWRTRLSNHCATGNAYSFVCADCPSNAIMGRLTKDGLLVKVGHTEQCTPTKTFESLMQEAGREIDFFEIQRLKQ